MAIAAFSVGRLPEILFGEGTLARAAELARRFGRRLLLVTGRRSFRASRQWPVLESALRARGLSWDLLQVETEPSPDLVDGAVARLRGREIHAVLAVGGGSAMDAAKAVAALLPTGGKVLDHLEEVGRGVPYEGPALPVIAVPTTAGTGSEATRNAVLSVRGKAGFKRSFRHDALVPRHAVVDPTLLETCPKEIVAADGMDALTQLVEAYASPRANPFTDALCESGLAAAREGLLPWYEERGDVPAARARMAFAALLSGVALAHAGLGAVHGLAAPMGAFFEAPHGAVCGTLLAATIEANVAALRAREPSSPALARYARAYGILSGSEGEAARQDAPERLAALLSSWTERLAVPRLGRFGVSADDVAKVVGSSRAGSMRTNPIVLSDEELSEVLRRRL